MNLSDIIRGKFLPPVMKTGINAVLDRVYKIIPNKDGYSAAIESKSPYSSAADYFSIFANKNGYLLRRMDFNKF